MRNIGMIAAVELSAVNMYYMTPKKKEVKGGFDVYIYEKEDKRLFVLHSGPGEISAAAATQVLISEYGCELITNFGVVGGLHEKMSSVKVAIVEKVVHYQFDTSEVDNVPVGLYLNEYPTIYMPTTPALIEKALTIDPTLIPVTCASGDKFIATSEEKEYIHQTFGADICEMEAAGIVKTANRNHVPVILLKMVADSVMGGASEYRSAFASASNQCIQVLDHILENM